MKKFFILLTAVALLAAGCKNYDDRFDDLNGQIATLTTQVQTLQGVASQVTGLQTEIKNIRASIQTDITTAVAGVSTALSTAQGELKDEIGTEVGRVSKDLSTAQTALNTQIGKLQKALEEASDNSLSQDHIDKLKTDLQTALAAAQKTALDTALAGLQTKLNALEQALAAASAGSLSQKDLDQLKTDIEAQLAQVKEELEASLGDGGFHSGSVEITSSGGWEATKRQLGNKTEFNGDFTINTEKLSATELDELIGWVAKITLIYGDLTITHKDKDKVLKFGQLTSITDLNDDQPHVHYPALTSAGIISLDGVDILTVQLPKLTTLTQFAGHEIDLRKGTALTLSALSAYTDDLSIDLGGTSAEIDVQALESVAKGNTGKLLTVIGPDEVALPALTTLEKLHIKEVRTLTAPKVKGADLEISEDVDHVEVGTADGAHINVLTLSDAADLKTLQIGGNPSTKASDGTVVVLNEDHTPKLEKAHIHGGRLLKVSDLEDLQEIITARSINTVEITGTGIEDELILGHDSGTNGILTIEHNTDIESLVADKVNKLKGLYIKGNHDLAKVSFKAFKVPGSQRLGTGAQWFTGDGFVIGKAGYGDYNDGQSAQDNKNDLIATEITQEILKADESVDRAGKIVDGTGLSDLAEVLQHANTKRAVISFDGTEAFKGQNKSAAAVEVATTQANHEDLILFRKGTADIEGTAGKAKRVFLVNDVDGSQNLTIGVGGTGFTRFSKAIDLTDGGSVRNWVVDINSAQVKSFFDTNDVEINAEVGGHPTTIIGFKAITDGDVLPATSNGSITLTIGKGNEAYSSTVEIGNGDAVDFSSSNKKAKTYVASDSDPLLTAIVDALIAPFPGFPHGADDNTDYTTSRTRGVAAATAGVPYGISVRYDHDHDNDLNTNEVSGARIGVLDAQKISDNIDVNVDNKIKETARGSVTSTLNPAGGRNAKVRTVGIQNDPNTIQITLTSKVAGTKENTVGDPIAEASTDSGSDGNDDVDYTLPTPPTTLAEATGATAYGTGTIVELPIADGNPRKSSLPKAATDDAGALTRGGEEFNRLDWL